MRFGLNITWQCVIKKWATCVGSGVKLLNITGCILHLPLSAGRHVSQQYTNTLRITAMSSSEGIRVQHLLWHTRRPTPVTLQLSDRTSYPTCVWGRHCLNSRGGRRGRPNHAQCVSCYVASLSLQDVYSYVSIRDERLNLTGWKTDQQTSRHTGATDADQKLAFKGRRRWKMALKSIGR